MPLFAAALLACTLNVVDGDTLRCGKERIRLLGIDAPEMPGHCRRGRRCVAGDPIASRDRLAAVVRRGGRVSIERRGQDRYGRTLAHVRVGGRDLACYQLAGRAAAYKERWDPNSELALRCYTPDTNRREGAR